MKTVVVFGNHKTGKTTVIESLIRSLTERGFSVATIKHIHSENFEPDKQHSDTQRHILAGSSLTFGHAKHLTAAFITKRINLDYIFNFIEEDYLIVEGNLPVKGLKIYCASTIDEIQNLDPEVKIISGKIANEMTIFQNIPVLHPINHKNQLVEIVIALSH